MEWWLWITWWFFKCIIKKLEKLPNNPPIHIYINSIENELVFKAKDRYKLELKTPETTKILGSTKKLIDNTQKMEKMSQILKLLK